MQLRHRVIESGLNIKEHAIVRNGDSDHAICPTIYTSRYTRHTHADIRDSSGSRTRAHYLNAYVAASGYDLEPSSAKQSQTIA